MSKSENESTVYPTYTEIGIPIRSILYKVVYWYTSTLTYTQYSYYDLSTVMWVFLPRKSRRHSPRSCAMPMLWPMPTSPPPMAHARTGARIERFETFVAGHASRSVVPVGVVWLRPLVLYESDF